MQKDFKKSWSEIYHELREPVLRYVGKLVPPHEMEDVCQEVFAKIALKQDTFKGRSKLTTWVYRIATNTAIDRIRSLQSRQLEAPLKGEVQETENLLFLPMFSCLPNSPPQELIASEMSACIREQVDKLPLKYRAVLALQSLEDLDNHEVAEILDISIPTVKIRLHRARAMLKKILEDKCHFYHNPVTGALACDRKSPHSS